VKHSPVHYSLGVALAATLTISACKQQAEETTVAESPSEINTVAEVTEARPLGSGIDFSGLNDDVRPQDDFFDYVNGTWVDNTEIPADKARWGSFDALREQSEKDVRAIVEEVSAAVEVADGSPAQKIRDFYNAYMDIEAATELGVEAIRSELDSIANINSLDDLYRSFAELGVYGVTAPIGGGIFSDMKEPDVNTIYIVQAGLTMPDRDYYLLDDEQFITARKQYLDYVTAVFNAAGFESGADRAEHLLALETRIAQVHWTKEENRDWSKRYNPKNLDELAEMAPAIDWNLILETAGFGGRDQYLVSQPSFFEALNGIMTETGLNTWKDYLTFQTISTFAPVMGEEYFTLNFNFFRKALSGVEEPEELWKRAVGSVNGNMGELLGQLYVEKHFQQSSKARMDELIANLINAYEASINELEWMSAETRVQALDKLSKFRPMVGYPEKWIDYSNLKVEAGNLMANVKSGAEFAYNRELDKLDKPVDKTEWQMTPQTVNAYYNPVWNVIVFPASILQPPFFNVEADDAVNYGGIGAVIGHEIGHGFDDSGSRFDGDGVLRNWWTDEDRAAFDVRKNALAAQYDGYEVIDGSTINGQFTSGENIGDLGGLSIAYKAYKTSLNGEEAPVIDGLTGDQRFFLGWAQVWRAKSRDEETRRRLTADPHSPPKFRANGAAVNVTAFYEAFDVKEGDGMYLPPEERVKIW
jgi:endothelin-converting enzyme/putative endopeptidase